MRFAFCFKHMNTDEKFNYYVELMATKHGDNAADRLETAMSQMLEMHVSEHLVWAYAKKIMKEQRP